jgi:hypothetical protein
VHPSAISALAGLLNSELAVEAIKQRAFQLREALVNDENSKTMKNAVELVQTLEKA